MIVGLQPDEFDADAYVEEGRAYFDAYGRAETPLDFLRRLVRLIGDPDIPEQRVMEVIVAATLFAHPQAVDVLKDRARRRCPIAEPVVTLVNENGACASFSLPWKPMMAPEMLLPAKGAA